MSKSCEGTAHLIYFNIYSFFFPHRKVFFGHNVSGKARLTISDPSFEEFT